VETIALVKVTCMNQSIDINIVKGDITKVACDAIVNPANSLMIMGGGVAGALRREAGESVEREAKRFAPVPVGEAIVTSAGKLQPKTRFIIHAPTMERPAMRTTSHKVEKAAMAALKQASRLGVNCLAIPLMGAGVGGLSVEESMNSIIKALDSVAGSINLPSKILIVAYLDKDVKSILKALPRLKTKKCSIHKAR